MTIDIFKPGIVTIPKKLFDYSIEQLYNGYYSLLISSPLFFGKSPNMSLHNPINRLWLSYLPGIHYIYQDIDDNKLEGLKLCRIVRYPADKLPHNRIGCSYPPLRQMSTFQRCNFEGQQIFYGAESETVAYREAKLNIGQHYVIGVWRLRKPMGMRFIHFLINEHINHPLSSIPKFHFEKLKKT